jgi:hypothetical protein
MGHRKNAVALPWLPWAVATVAKSTVITYKVIDFQFTPQGCKIVVGKQIPSESPPVTSGADKPLYIRFPVTETKLDLKRAV